MPKVKLSVSLVIYKNDFELVEKALNSIYNTKMPISVVIVDNSPVSDICLHKSPVIDKLLTMPNNPGFGYAHNKAVELLNFDSDFHLIINPDIYFDSGVLETLVDFLETNPDVGVVMPKVLYPDNQIQYLAKLLPTPVDFFFRRLIPNGRLKEYIINNNFELRESNYNKIFEAPYLSGCFLMFRTDVFKLIRGFDENIFLYGEDIDICRRVIQAGYRSVFYPYVSIYHSHIHKSFTNLNTLKYYLTSAFYYFNKWGWFFDRERTKINKKVISQFRLL